MHKTKVWLNVCAVKPAQQKPPSWDQIYEIAAAQEGLVTTRQAAAIGYSPQLLVHHVHAGRLERVRRGIYRLVHFPPGEHEDLVVVWLWSEQAGVFSHQTALSLHGLSDVLPSRVHLTLPDDWQKRRFRVPKGVVLHYADISRSDRSWFGAVPVTSVRVSLNDCARAHLSPELLRQGALEALQRGLVARKDIPEVMKALKPFGGLAA